MKKITSEVESMQNNILSSEEVMACVSRSCPVECICPKCRGRHVMRLKWTGRGSPRKFCASCRSSLHVFGSLALDEPVKIPQAHL